MYYLDMWSGSEGAGAGARASAAMAGMAGWWKRTGGRPRRRPRRRRRPAPRRRDADADHSLTATIACRIMVKLLSISSEK